MAVPGHGYNCSSTLWRTKCPNCRRPVFFFSCSCGSKVFFEKTGDPWPRHTNCVPPNARPIAPVKSQRLPLLVVSPEGDERQVAGRIVEAEATIVRGIPFVLVTIEEHAQLGSSFALQIAFLVSRRIYLALHCQPGDNIWAMLKPPDVSGQSWVADEVQLLK